MRELPPALQALASHRQFIVWQLVPSTPKDKKYPIDWRSGSRHDAHDPAIWLDAQSAISLAATYGSGFGVGFVFTDADPFFFLDLDACLTRPERYVLAQEAYAQFPGAAVEISQSGTGLHIIGTYRGAAPEHSCRRDDLGLELYTSRRFVALTGNQAQGDAGVDCTAALGQYAARYFPPSVAAGDRSEWRDEPRADYYCTSDDDDLIRRMLQSTSAAAAFGGKASFADLWKANETVLSRAYPSDTGDAYNRSSADAALAQHLAFWTGCNHARMDRLMRRSALAREKWDSHGGYMHLTIGGACAKQVEVLRDTPLAVPPGPGASVSPAVPPAPTSAAPPAATSRWVTVDGLAQVFAGCTYVLDSHQVLCPGGTLMNPEQFKSWYGGYSFVMDANNEKTSKNAWEAFTQNQAWAAPRVRTSVFRPGSPVGAVIELNDQRTAVNRWWPIKVPRQAGDPAPFLQHLARLLPNPKDQTILLAYMAACVQHQGVKFQWAPILQGVEGNGKTTLGECVAEAVGSRYVFWPMADQLTEKFNAWLVDHTFFPVEEIYVSHGKAEVLEKLKRLITGRTMSVEPKGVDSTTREVCGNFMFFTNHDDGVPKRCNDRRYAPFFCAQQNVKDLARDGLTQDYFSWLYGWLRDQGGYAIVAEFLWTYAIPEELNPAKLCQRAPVTSSTEEAISAGLGLIEQHIVEAVEQDREGFRGGWISSLALTRLLTEIKRDVPPNRRRKLMQELGYDWHPGLKSGRTNGVVLPDAGKPVLFVKAGHPTSSLADAYAVAKAYTDAQSR